MFQPGERYSEKAGADLTGKRHYLVKLNSNGQVVLASSATDNILGVLDNEPKQGAVADVVMLNGSGTFQVILAADTAKDVYLTADSNGKAVATTTTGNRVFGRLMRAGLAGEFAEYVKLNEKY